MGKNVAQALGYKNPQEAIRTHVDEEDKGVVKHDTPGGTAFVLCLVLSSAKVANHDLS